MRSGIVDSEASPLDVLAQAVERAAADDVHRLTGDALGESIIEVDRLISALHAERTRRRRVFDARRDFVSSGALSTAAWLRAACRMAPGPASEQVLLARRLPQLPQAEQAFAEGAINAQHAAVLARTLDEVGEQAAREAEPDLVQVARCAHPGELRNVTRYLRHCANPEACLDDAAREDDRRSLHLSPTLDGVFYIEGRLTSECGTALRVALDAIAGPPSPDDTRSAAQRRHDAMDDLAHTRLDAGDLPRTGGQRPHLTVMADLATLRGQPGCGPGELDDGVLVPAETVRRLGCDAIVSTIVTGEGGDTHRTKTYYTWHDDQHARRTNSRRSPVCA